MTEAAGAGAPHGTPLDRDAAVADPRASRTAIRRALRRARDGVTLNPTEAVSLLYARGDEFQELLACAAQTRDAMLVAAGRPGVITYSRKVFIPLTRLCRDRCHYCTFATTPRRVDAPYLSLDEVVAIARAGAAAGCKEALFTLGDRPETRWRAAREWLAVRGYASTVDYLRACAIAVLEETGLLPHLNPGVLSWAEIARLKPVAPSMGMMLETVSERLWATPGAPHFGSPDKNPATRLRVLEDAGRLTVPFTTGILIGIGETLDERVASIFAIRRIAREYRGIQEVIVQNFRAKPDTPMRDVPDADLTDLAATIAVARLILGPAVHVQAPPNLVDHQFALMLAAGIDDWGGVSPVTIDHVNPERPWPQIEELGRRTAEAGFRLMERLAVYPEYVRAGEPWVDPRLAGHISALADPGTGLADPRARPAGRPWQEPDGGWKESTGRIDLASTIDTEGRRSVHRSDIDAAFGDWTEVGHRLRAQRERHAKTGAPHRLARAVLTALRHAEKNPAELSDADALALMTADGPELEAVCRFADELRRDAVGDAVTYVATRNINFTNVCYTGCRFCAFAQRRNDPDAYTLSLDDVGRRVEEAWAAGATEICMQGGIHPDLPGTAYFELAREVKRRAPHIHLHAFSPMEVVNGAARSGMSIRDWLMAAKEAGVDSLPGTAAEILDDEVRWVLTKGKLPAATWVEVIRTAHEIGLPTTATMMYGHVDTPAHWVAHLKLLGRIQQETGGFTEFVALPFVHTAAPLYLAGLARPGPTMRENRAVHAMARILLHGRVRNIQCSWVKLGVDGCVTMLRGGANDLGGTLMEETISRMAGSTYGSAKTVHELEAIAAAAGRPARQRTTLYGEPPAERIEAARRVRSFAAGPQPLAPLSRS
ncbi:FO synthase subunit 1 / FO synthase subunit 2 [Acidothermus cellulolyticus 11B]|uniref:FO synthase n=1 Tax=Acidothermus cellulolyticus (strain ATCC 43068 / DSM 8971 / 11B) TaxID=351607 RepID=A0LSY2_ACIC1|nr:bifunctional FO biosynthesis protein CofGH [Acidothermus cellulolyticus]ABK52542.1 FO synthase subunit 1 / FO synthase subunit 2 [Acidothermus cellulolyticus 11B]